MLSIQDLTYRIAGRTLISEASVQVPAGHRVGLVGRNGAGKSTLLKLIAGDLQPDQGGISLPQDARMAMVRQEVPGGPTSLIDTVLAADTERTSLLAEAETATDAHRIAEIHERLDHIGAYSATARAAQILSGLGFDEAAQARPTSDYSGGWRMRVALASVLFLEPDVLLLDEPTNHLDLEAALWLVGYLKSYPKTVVLVSHDRDLLNEVPEAILHLDRGGLTLYRGNFDQFVRQRRERAALAEAEARKQEERRAHLQAFVDRFRYKASKARQAQSRIKMLERMEPVAAILEDNAPTIRLPAPDDLAPPLVTLDDAAVGYDGHAVLKNLKLRLDPDDRIALLGANGNGKSTLVKLIAGRLEAMAGHVTRAGKLKVAYFAQHQVDELDPTRTVLQEASRALPDKRPQEVRSFLGSFGFPQDRVETEVSALSGGEKARLLLALISRSAPHLLLLDEPTNHLDIETRDALIEALNEFPGAVILVAHDPHIVEMTADRLWLVADGTCRPFDGDLDDYKRQLLDQRRAERSEARRAVGDANPASRRDDRRAAAEKRQRLAPLKKALDQAEKRMADLEAKRAKLQEEMADPALYAGDPGRLTQLQKKLGTVEKDLEAAEQAWIEAAEAYEEANAEAA